MNCQRCERLGKALKEIRDQRLPDFNFDYLATGETIRQRLNQFIFNMKGIARAALEEVKK